MKKCKIIAGVSFMLMSLFFMLARNSEYESLTQIVCVCWMVTFTGVFGGFSIAIIAEWLFDESEGDDD